MNSISYVLSADEVKQALFTAGALKPYKKKMLLILAFSVVFCVLTFVPGEPTTYSIIVALGFANLFAYYGYKKHEENTVRGSTTGELTVLTAYDTYINVVVEAYDANWNIEKQDVLKILENDLEVIIALDDGRLMAIPKRVLVGESKSAFEKVLNYLCDTTAKNQEKIGE